MKKFKIGLISFPGGKTGIIPLTNLIDILSHFSISLDLITGNEGYNSFKNDSRLNIHESKHGSSTNSVNRILSYLMIQFKMSYEIIKIKEVDQWVFFIGGDTLLVPMLISKILRKKVLMVFAGSSIETLKSSNDGFHKFAYILSQINNRLSDEIVIYSENLIKEWEMERFRNKITVEHRHFLDFNRFKIIKKYNERENLIGYIGRLSNEKGAMNFVKYNNDFKFIICGEGILDSEIKEYLKDNNLNGKVKVLNWISHDEIPDYLNELKLLVIPSYTEGLPNIMLESMACGTPVLATPVGAIPDIIKDENNGFIMVDNSPKCIRKNILKIMDYHKINEILENAFILVENEYTQESVLKKWEKIINRG
jgi:glycosyltransferase involved in cell wall biosynthesis